MRQRLVIIGGDATGMSAAAQARRRRGEDQLEIVAFERGNHVSYSACGIPYWIAGDVEGPQRLVMRDPAEHRRRGIDVRLRTEVEGIDLDRRELHVRGVEDGRGERVGFDQLVIATGAVPVRPRLPGIDARGVYGVQTLDDGTALLDGLRARPRHAVVVGGGYIGVEMAEAMVRRGLRVRVVDQAREPMPTLDQDMGRLVREAMEGMGIEVVTGAAVEGLEVDREGRVEGVATAARTYPADLVVLGVGMRPNTALAVDAGLPVGASGGLRVDAQMRVDASRVPLGETPPGETPPGETPSGETPSGETPPGGAGTNGTGIWAGGDCVEVFHRVFGRYAYVPLGTHANKHGRIIGINATGGDERFPGVVGTAVSRVCDLEIARTGLREQDAEALGIRYRSATADSTSRASYFPGTAWMTLKMIAERDTGRLLGMQIVGRGGAAKRIDTAAVALWHEMTVPDILGLDLAYAPPFSPVWDPVLVVARSLAGAVGPSEPAAPGSSARVLPGSGG